MISTKLAILAFFLTVVSAQDPLKTCDVTIDIMKRGMVEKTLCFIKKDTSGNMARGLCNSNGMRLYDASTSPASKNGLANFAKTVLKGNSKIQVFIAGRKDKDMCRVIQGDGSSDFIRCSFFSFVACEYVKPTVPPTTTTMAPTTTTTIAPTTTTVTTTTTPIPPIECASYLVQDFADYNVDTTGVSTPTWCQYQANPIVTPTTTIVSDSTHDKNTITSLIMGYVAGTLYLPINVATSFPELRAIAAPNCAITTVTYEHLQGLFKLTSLNLSGNQITTLDKEAFKDLTKLWVLIFQNNPLTHLSATLFSTTLPLIRSVYFEPAGCISVYIGESRTEAAALPGSVTHTCTLLA